MFKTITGTISHGTLRSQDLLPCFLQELKNRGIANPSLSIPNWVQNIGEDCEWWSSEECNEILETTFNELDLHAPKGFYFGAHYGDGSDFGFWPIEDQED